ncbi:Tellurite methyltransferase [termite gut metagenome]|uniref:Tellurite methyltransferase n=1 Tax=termite gut metagenome TaxID=433724 RepID=A0A5J4QS92_9ZZZZ
MKEKYQIEYENSNGCFWAKEPAKFVKLFVKKYCADLRGLKGLDLGAEEGKNAVFLASKGAKVLAIDISTIALSRFNQQPNYSIAQNSVEVKCSDIRDINFDAGSFDFIVAYGILYCLSSTEEVKTYIEKIKSWIVPNGYFICVTFTNELPPPQSQSYLEYESFLKKGELEKSLDDWTILEQENDVITETHPTCPIEHKHSLIRLIAKKHG